jgi:hypothetical protein
MGPVSIAGCIAFPCCEATDAALSVSNDQLTWDILGPAQEWTTLTAKEQGEFEFYVGELARQFVFKSETVIGDSAMELLLPSSGMDVPVDIAHFGSESKLWFSEVKTGRFRYFSGTQFFGFKRRVEERVAKPRNFYLLLSPAGSFGILPAAMRDVRKLGFAQKIFFKNEWWEDFF